MYILCIDIFVWEQHIIQIVPPCVQEVLSNYSKPGRPFQARFRRHHGFQFRLCDISEVSNFFRVWCHIHISSQKKQIVHFVFTPHASASFGWRISRTIMQSGKVLEVIKRNLKLQQVKNAVSVIRMHSFLYSILSRRVVETAGCTPSTIRLILFQQQRFPKDEYTVPYYWQ